MVKYNVILQCLRSGKAQLNNVQQLQFMSARWATAVAAEQGASFDKVALATAKPFQDIPGPTAVPLLGTTWIYFPIIGRYKLSEQHLGLLDKRKRYGHIVREQMGPFNLVISFNADDMQTLFKNEGPYPSRGEVDSLKAYRESRKQWYSSNGLLVLQGKEWHDLRFKAQKHLMKPKSVMAYTSPMQEVARDFVDKIRKVRDSNKEVPNFLGELYKWALESVAFVGLDARLGCLRIDLKPDSDGTRMINAVQGIFEGMNNLEALTGNLQFWKYFPTPAWKKFCADGDTFTEIAFKYINRSLDELKKSADEDKDLTLLQSMLMTEGLDRSGAMVMVADMLMAGIDTTSHTVGFFLYQIAKNPDKQECLYREIKELLPRKEDRVTPELFNELKYLKACIKESQRLQPIAGGVARRIDRDIVLSGYRVPAETIVLMGLQGIYLDEKYFSDPLRYIPERWLEKEDKFHPFAFVPFGVGTRSCIGRRLAELEIISVATEIIRNFKLEYHHGDIGMTTRLVNTPDKPLRFNFIER